MRVVIVGAGAAGLSAAYDLTRRGHAVTVFEADDRVGGLASGFRESGWAWSVERFYHHWFQTDRDVFRLIRELGAADRLRSKRPITALWQNGQAHQFDSPLSLLRFPGLSMVDKLRLGMVLFGLQKTDNWRALESAAAHEWLIRRVGRRAYETIWEPLLAGKFSEAHYREVNMAWFWARIHSRTPTLWTFEGGFQAFLDLLAARCSSLGAVIHLKTPVLSIDQAERGTHHVRTGAGDFEAEACIVTGSPGTLTRLVRNLHDDYDARTRSLKSIGAVVLLLTLDRSLTPHHYWTSLPKSHFPFLVLVEHTHFVPPDRFGGNHIVYCGDYCPADHHYFKMAPERLFEVFTSALKSFNRQFDPSWIKRWWLYREPYAQPIPTVDYSRSVPHPRTPHKMLYWLSMSQVYPWDRGTNHAVRLGREVARMVERDYYVAR